VAARSTRPGRHRTLLLRGYDTPSARARDRLDEVFETDDPTSELTAWGVKEAQRLILASPTLDDARAAKARFHNWVRLADTAKPASCSAAPTGRGNTVDQPRRHGQLRIAAECDKGYYPLGFQISNAEFAELTSPRTTGTVSGTTILTARDVQTTLK